jgi:hypothetical protein
LRRRSGAGPRRRWCRRLAGSAENWLRCALFVFGWGVGTGRGAPFDLSNSIWAGVGRWLGRAEVGRKGDRWEDFRELEIGARMLGYWGGALSSPG